MKIVKIKEELDSFQDYTTDSFVDQNLWQFISKVKALSVQYNDPYFAQMFLSKCLLKMEEFLEKRGPRTEEY